MVSWGMVEQRWAGSRLVLAGSHRRRREHPSRSRRHFGRSKTAGRTSSLRISDETYGHCRRRDSWRRSNGRRGLSSTGEKLAGLLRPAALGERPRRPQTCSVSIDLSAGPEAGRSRHWVRSRRRNCLSASRGSDSHQVENVDTVGNERRRRRMSEKERFENERKAMMRGTQQ